MPQKNYPVMVSVDWLQLSCKSFDPIAELPLAWRSDDGIAFVWSKQSYGNKQYKSVYTIDVVNLDGVVTPFAVLQCEPTLESWSSCRCSLKLSNHILYQTGTCGWQRLLPLFLDVYRISVQNVTRCDIAGDFLYLANRLSGAQLVRKLKDCSWWKLGTTKVHEYYKLPYSIKQAENAHRSIYESQVFWQADEFVPRTESMTFGTLSSDAQVCLYDKTLELMRSEVDIEKDGQKVKESAKEYIRDCWKEAGVYDPKRHTWRLEIRLKNTCLFIADTRDGMQRTLCLDDIISDKLTFTFLAAVERYFSIVDPSEGGKHELTTARLLSLQSHKSRLPKVRLFSYENLVRKMCKRPIHKAANAHNRAVIKRIESLADKAKQANEIKVSEEPRIAISHCLDTLRALSKSQTIARRYLQPSIDRLNILLRDIYTSKKQISEAELTSIEAARDVLVRHLRTEAPTFTKHVYRSLKDMQLTISPSSHNELYKHTANAFSYEDSVVLREAAEIVKAVYSSTAAQQRKEDKQGIFTKWFEEAANHIIQGGRMTYFVFNRIKWCFSELSPFTAEQQAEYRRKYNSKLLLDVMKCYNYNDYLIRHNLMPVDEDFDT